MKKTTRLTVAAMLLTLTLAGCGSRQNESQPEASVIPPREAPSPAPPQEEAKPAPIPQQEVTEAALNGKTETVREALAQGYKVNSRDPENRTALMYAAFNGQTAVVKMLIEAGADVNAQDKVGTSALMFAASAPGGAETVQVLLDSGAKVNMTDNNEHFTALMWAAAEGQIDNVKLLLKYKADTTLKDIDGDTAESFAAKKGHTAITQLLNHAAQEQAPEKPGPE